MSRVVRILASLLGLAHGLAQPGSLPAQPSISPLPTSDTALLGRFERGPIHLPLQVSAVEFDAVFGSANAATWPAEAQARQFFANGGTALHVVRISGGGPLAESLTGQPADLSGLHALTPLTNLRLLIAPELALVPAAEFTESFARFRAFLEARRIFFILDPPPGLAGVNEVATWVGTFVPSDASCCALYFPYLRVTLNGAVLTLPASGAMAGIYARADSANGIWRSPAGTGLPLQATALSPVLSSADSDALNAQGVSAVRDFAATGIVPWGARTLDRTRAENRYISVVRTRGWTAASIERGLAFAASQDNNATLWSQIRSSVGAFLHSLFQQGALAGSTPSEAYYVRCDAQTTTSTDIAAHRVNVAYGTAMLRPAEFEVTFLTAATYDAARTAIAPGIQAGRWRNELFLSHPTEAGFHYVLERNPGLQSAAWNQASPSIPGDGAWRQVQIPVTELQQSYRVRVVPAR